MKNIDAISQDREALVLWNKAVEFANTGNIDAAAETFLRLAEANYEGAAFALGGILATPNTRYSDLENAIKWFQKAVSDENDVKAMVALARIYLTEGGKSNIAKARFFLEQASESDDVVALTALGEIFEEGYIGDRDAEAAELHYIRAAKLGGVFAMLRLSNLSWNNRQFIRWVYWRARALGTAFKIAVSDHEDRRLWRIGQNRRVE